MKRRLDYEASVALGLKAGARIKDCFRNALGALRDCPQRTKFVVGYADGIEHAWLETRGGRILDPTLGAPEHRTRSARFERYRAVKWFTWRQISHAACSNATWFRAISLTPECVRRRLTAALKRAGREARTA